MRLSLIFLLLLATLSVSAQQTLLNKFGHYKIVVPQHWTAEQDGEITSVYAPDEGEMDSWKEKLEISLTDANDLSLEEAFTFYIEEDLPTMYNQFQIVRQGEEVVNGQKMKWAVFSFSGSGTVGTNQVSFTLYNLFYLALDQQKLFMLNAIAEKDYYSKLENDFLKIVRSFQVVK